LLRREHGSRVVIKAARRENASEPIDVIVTRGPFRWIPRLAKYGLAADRDKTRVARAMVSGHVYR
jgi:hypothetical protein